MRRWWVLLPSLLLPLSLANVAYADDDCPPGSWFCEDVEVQKPEADVDADADADADVDTEAQKPKAQPGKKKKKHKKKRKKTKTVEVEGEGDTVIVVDDDTDKVVVVEKTTKVAPPPPPAKKKKRRWAEKFGLNLRLEGAAFPPADGVYEDVGMGGVGASFRWRPSPYFAFDLGTDVLGGNDYYGHERVEVSGALSGIVYFNPQHRVQVYGIGGINLSHAWIDTDEEYYFSQYSGRYYDSDTAEVEHDYVGGHGGLGVEFRIARHVALHIDALALIRRKVDDSPPEFTDNAGNTTDTSGAGLFRAGIIFWW